MSLHTRKSSASTGQPGGAGHDIVFPMENWYALNGQLPTLQLVTFPCAGHGPQQQYPLAAAGYIASFVKSSDG